MNNKIKIINNMIVINSMIKIIKEEIINIINIINIRIIVTKKTTNQKIKTKKGTGPD